MNIELIAVVLAVVAYAFSEIGIDNDLLIIVLVVVLLFDLLDLEETLIGEEEGEA